MSAIPRPLRGTTTAILIDIQEKFAKAISDFDRIQERAVLLVRGLKIMSLPILVTEQNSAKLGPTAAPLVAALETYRPIEKMTFSALGHPAVREGLKKNDARQVILFGVEAHVCILQTGLDLLQDGFDVFLPADAISSRSSLDCQAALARLREAGAVMTTVESLLFELLKTAEAPEFRTISKMIKEGGTA